MGESKQRDTVDPVARAEQLHAAGLSCAPAILAAFAPRLGMEEDQAARVASCFGGGMMGSGGLCGAVTGSMMAIGLALGPGARRDPIAKQCAYRHATQLWERVRQRWGSIECRDILGVDISSAAGHARAKEENLFATRCRDVIQNAAKIVNEVLQLESSKR